MKNRKGQRDVVNKRLLEWQMRNQEVERNLGLQIEKEQKSD